MVVRPQPDVAAVGGGRHPAAAAGNVEGAAAAVVAVLVGGYRLQALGQRGRLRAIDLDLGRTKLEAAGFASQAGTNRRRRLQERARRRRCRRCGASEVVADHVRDAGAGQDQEDQRAGPDHPPHRHPAPGCRLRRLVAVWLLVAALRIALLGVLEVGGRRVLLLRRVLGRGWIRGWRRRGRKRRGRRRCERRRRGG